MVNRLKMVVTLLVLAAVVAGCKLSKNANSVSSSNSNSSKTSAPQPNSDGVIRSATGVEKEKPAAGKANVQGKVFYNEKPAADIEVKLCTTFSRFVGGCGGEIFDPAQPPLGIARLKVGIEIEVARRRRRAFHQPRSVKDQRRPRSQDPRRTVEQAERGRPRADVDHVDAENCVGAFDRPFARGRIEGERGPKVGQSHLVPPRGDRTGQLYECSGPG